MTGARIWRRTLRRFRTGSEHACHLRMSRARGDLEVNGNGNMSVWRLTILPVCNLQGSRKSTTLRPPIRVTARSRLHAPFPIHPKPPHSPPSLLLPALHKPLHPPLPPSLSFFLPLSFLLSSPPLQPSAPTPPPPSSAQPAERNQKKAGGNRSR